MKAATEPAEQERLIQKLRPDLGKYSKRILAIAQKEGASDLGCQCVSWILRKDRLGRLEKKAPNDTVRALAELGSARLLVCEREIAMMAREGNPRAKYVISLFGEDYQQHLNTLDCEEHAFLATIKLEHLRRTKGKTALGHQSVADEVDKLLQGLIRKKEKDA